MEIMEPLLNPGDLSREQGLEYFDKLQFRKCGPIAFGDHFTYTDLQGSEDGVKWFDIARTDLCDDVCTGHCFDVDTPVEEMVEHYRKCILWGARIRETGTFAGIDAMTDG